MRIKLSKRDCFEAELLAQDTVYLIERFAGVEPKKVGNNINTNTLGCKAEYAVARVLGTELPKLNFLSDNGVDLWSGDVSIDVKYTTSEGGDLIFNTADNFKAMVSVLVAKTSQPDVMRIVGWTNKSDFVLSAKKKDFGYGERMAMACKHLRPIEELWRKITERKYA